MDALVAVMVVMVVVVAGGGGAAAATGVAVDGEWIMIVDVMGGVVVVAPDKVALFIMAVDAVPSPPAPEDICCGTYHS